MFNLNRTNAVMACPARPLANKADECRTLKQNNTDSPNHQVFKTLPTGRVKTIHIGNTRTLNYATFKKKKVLQPQHSPSVASTSCSSMQPSVGKQYQLMHQHEFPFLLFNAKRIRLLSFYWFLFSLAGKSCNQHYKSASVLTFCFPNSRSSCLAMHLNL